MVGSMVSFVLALAVFWGQPGFGSAHRSHNRHENTLTAANVAQLTEVWRTSLGARVNSPVVSGKRAFVAAGQTVVALRTETGRERWRATDEEVFELASPLLDGAGRLRVPWSALFGGGVSVYDPRTGALLIRQPEFHLGIVGMTVRGGAFATVEYVYGSGGPVLVRLLTPAGTGFLWFSSVFPLPLLSQPILFRDHAYVAVDGSVYGFPLDRCDEGPSAGDISFCAPDVTSADVDAASVVGFGGRSLVASSDASLSVLNATTGATLWTAALATEAAVSPAVANHRIFAPGADGDVHVFNARGCGMATCEALWTADVGSPIAGGVVVAGDVLYVGTKDGTVAAFDARGCEAASCESLWTSPDLGDAITGGPVVAGGTLYVGTADGSLVAFRPPTDAAAH